MLYVLKILAAHWLKVADLDNGIAFTAKTEMSYLAMERRRGNLNAY